VKPSTVLKCLSGTCTTLSEFDDNALRQIERMGESKYEPERQLAEERAWREILKDAHRDLLLDMLIGLLAEKFSARK
jgi:aminoglycoside phosphotransferase family enzyme